MTNLDRGFRRAASRQIIRKTSFVPGTVAQQTHAERLTAVSEVRRGLYRLDFFTALLFPEGGEN
jgi:hypothetical protein